MDYYVVDETVNGHHHCMLLPQLQWCESYLYVDNVRPVAQMMGFYTFLTIFSS